MNDITDQTDWSVWFSTYSTMTAERLLGRFNIKLSHEDLVAAVKDSTSVYYQLLRVPLKNIFNGIIFQQAHDYQIYAQKLFVDYLLSGEDTRDESSPGATLRADLETARLTLIEMSDEFHVIEVEHQTLIAESQARLIHLTRDLDTLKKIVVDDFNEMKNQLVVFIDRAEAVNVNLRSFRNQFYTHILRVTDLLKLLPDYKIDEIKQAENREALDFDSLIGER